MNNVYRIGTSVLCLFAGLSIYLFVFSCEGPSKAVEAAKIVKEVSKVETVIEEVKEVEVELPTLEELLPVEPVTPEDKE